MYQNIKTEITAAGYVPVTLPTGVGCASYSLWAEDGKAFYIASLSDGSDGILVAASDPTKCFPISINQVYGPGQTVGYAKGTTSTNLVGIITNV